MWAWPGRRRMIGTKETCLDPCVGHFDTADIFSAYSCFWVLVPRRSLTTRVRVRWSVRDTSLSGHCHRMEAAHFWQWVWWWRWRCSDQQGPDPCSGPGLPLWVVLQEHSQGRCSLLLLYEATLEPPPRPAGRLIIIIIKVNSLGQKKVLLCKGISTQTTRKTETLWPCLSSK